MRIALTRPVSESMGNCELTYLPRIEIDLRRARAQHHAYTEALAALGCQVLFLPEEPDLPDSVFVEDMAVVLDEVAVLARPGAESRRPETTTVAARLQTYRQVVPIEPPGTLDGGDVLCVGQTLYVGQSSRTNRAGLKQLDAAVAPFGYRVEPVPVHGCLHLKSAVTQVGPEMLLYNPTWVGAGRFAGLDLLEVDPAEPHAANALYLGGPVLYPASFPRTAARLARRGIPVHTLDLSELQKAEGAVTCCSLVFESQVR